MSDATAESVQLLPESAAADASVGTLLAAAAELLQVAYDRVGADSSRLSEDELLADMTLAQQVQNCAWGVQTHRITQAAALEHRQDPNPVAGALPRQVSRMVRHEPGSYVDEWFPLEVATRLGWSDRQAANRIEDAISTLTQCPRLLDRVGAGGLDSWKATVIAQVTTGAPEHVAETIEERILTGDPEGTTATKLRAKARRLRVRLDPIGSDVAATARRRSAVGVFVAEHHEPGLSQLTAILPTMDAAKLMAAIDDLAQYLHSVTTTDKTLAECRVDALTDLALTGVGIDTHLTFHIPVDTPGAVTPAPETQSDGVDETGIDWAAEGLIPIDGRDLMDEELRALFDEELVELNTQAHGRRATRPPPPGGRTPTISPPAEVLLPRVGIIPADVITEMTQLLGVKLSRALTDATTGTVIETSDRSYRPGARLARFIQTRDQHCRFPGCTRPAKLSDIDHVIRYPDGETTAGNLQCLCRHHHRAKHEGGWHVRMSPDGECTWTSPTGHTYVTIPAD